MNEYYLSIIIMIFLVAFLFFTTIKIISIDTAGPFGLMFCLYHIFFYALPAIVHIKIGKFPFYAMSYPSGAILSAAQVSLGFIVSFVVGYFYIWKSTIFMKNKVICYDDWTKKINEKYNIRYIVAAIVVMMFMQVLIIIYYGVNVFFAGRNEAVGYVFGADSASVVLISAGIRSLSFVCLLTSLFLLRINGYGRYILIISSAGLFFIINNPAAISRFQFFSYILTIMYVFSRVGYKFKMAISIGILFGVITIFPLMSHVARGSGDFELNIISYYSENGDFDGFQSLINIIQMVDALYLSMGRQLIGAVLVFVPRAIWPSKPDPTGVSAAQYAGYDFTNISAPVVGEIFVDFGWVGIVLIGFLLGGVFRRCDLEAIYAGSVGDVGRWVVCGIIFSFLVILMRGSLMGVLAPVYTELLIAYIILRFTKNGSSGYKK